MSHQYYLPSLYNDDGDNFIIIAHRGASAYYPENTMAAFKAAVEMGAEMLELDVMMSQDGVPVVFHDTRLSRRSNGKGYLPNHTLAELKKLDAGSWFDPRFSDQKIPTLEEALAFAAGKIAVNIEIKSQAVSGSLIGGVEKKSLDLVRKYGMENYVLFSSFNYEAVRSFKKLNPTIPVALLYDFRQSNEKLPHQIIREHKADAFNCSQRQLTKKWIEDLREHKIPSFIYTVDSESKMRKLVAAGVTGIFTNKPDVLARVVKDYQK